MVPAPPDVDESVARGVGEDAANGDRLAHRLDLDVGAGVRRVDHLPVADVDPDMARAARCRLEEDEVARLRLRQARHRGSHVDLLLAGARQRDAEVAVHMLDEARAVEARGGVGATPAVRDAEVLLGVGHHRRPAHPRPRARTGRVGRVGRVGEPEGRARRNRATHHRRRSPRRSRGRPGRTPRSTPRWRCRGRPGIRPTGRRLRARARATTPRCSTPACGRP